MGIHITVRPNLPLKGMSLQDLDIFKCSGTYKTNVHVLIGSYALIAYTDITNSSLYHFPDPV